MADFVVNTGINDIKARELTVKDARNLLKSIQDQAQRLADHPEEHDSLDELFEDVSLFEIRAITGLETLDDLHPSELRKIADACKRANPHFFGMRERERQRMKDIMEKNPDLLTNYMKRESNKLLSESKASSETA